MHLPELKPDYWMSLLLLVAFPAAATAQMQFPETPPPGQLVQDYVGIISDADQAAIRKIQFRIYEQHDTPIAVVTIASKSEFKAKRESIERVAHDLFNHWQIGKRDENDRLINQGILLLVSVGDRRARIELGADWRREWDDHCEEIMQRGIIPHFKKGDYSTGIREGVVRLAKMAEAGPSGSMPFSLTDEINEPMLEGINPFPRWIGLLMIVAGIGLIALGFLFPEFQTPLVLAGIGLILFALLYKAVIWVIFMIFVLMGGGSSSSSDGGGWSGGGGFSSGGFSGGGGATGSW